MKTIVNKYFQAFEAHNVYERIDPAGELRRLVGDGLESEILDVGVYLAAQKVLGELEEQRGTISAKKWAAIKRSLDSLKKPATPLLDAIMGELAPGDQNRGAETA
jgi:hypothetical protein